MEDLKGKRYGKLVVIEYSGKGHSGLPMWKCKCDCGNNSVVRAPDLLSGNTKSCGCLKRFKEDMTGKEFGMLKVIKYAGSKKGVGSLWLCKCECGNEKVMSRKTLIGGTKSCGCLCKVTKDGFRRKSERLYSIYLGMKARCYNKNDHAYRLYGERGISISPCWLGEDGYKNFREWSMNNGYSEELTIDRIDVNGNYEPNNCRWATMNVQSNNRRNTIRVKIGEREMTLSEISDLYNIKRQTLMSRYRAGCKDEQLITGKGLKRYEVNGNLYTADEIEEVYGVPKQQFRSRLGKGWSVDRAATFPYKKFIEKEIEYAGEVHTLREWSRISGINYHTLKCRLNNGCDAGKLFSKPQNRQSKNAD